MAEVIKMPRLSDTMEEGVVAQWLKKVGDKISEGDILAEIETDKATMEFESFYDGTLLHIAIEEGVAANVDSILCIIGEDGEDISSILNTKIEESSNSQLDLVDQINQQEKIDDNHSEIENADSVSTEKDKTVINENINVEYITMPRLSDTMEEGTISTWLKKVGDDISEGDILAEIETDKATMEFESFYSGKLVHIGVGEGETVKVDDLIAIISDSDVAVDDLLDNYGKDQDSTNNINSKDEITSTTDEKSIEDVSLEKPIVPTNNQSDLRVLASPLLKKLLQKEILIYQKSKAPVIMEG